MFREAAKASISYYMPAKSLELKHTIKLIREPDAEVKTIMDEAPPNPYHSRQQLPHGCYDTCRNW